MREKIEKMIETDYQLQKLFMTENPERIEFFGPETPKPESGTRKTSASAASRSSASVSAQPLIQIGAELLPEGICQCSLLFAVATTFSLTAQGILTFIM